MRWLKYQKLFVSVRNCPLLQLKKKNMTLSIKFLFQPQTGRQVASTVANLVWIPICWKPFQMPTLQLIQISQPSPKWLALEPVDDFFSFAGFFGEYVPKTQCQKVSQLPFVGGPYSFDPVIQSKYLVDLSGRISVAFLWCLTQWLIQWFQSECHLWIRTLMFWRHLLSQIMGWKRGTISMWSTTVCVSAMCRDQKVRHLK